MVNREEIEKANDIAGNVFRQATLRHKRHPPDAVDFAGDNEGEELFAGPERRGFNDRRHGHVTVPTRQLHEQIHHVWLLDEYVALRHLPHGAKSVLHNTCIEKRGVVEKIEK